MKRFVQSVAVAAILVTSGGLALADDSDNWGWGWGHGSGRGGMMGNPGFMGRMATIDNDGDGMISDDEAAAQVEAVFLAMDSDDDGELTEEEYMAVRMGSGEGRNPTRKAQMQERKKARFTEMDTDKNGKGLEGRVHCWRQGPFRGGRYRQGWQGHTLGIPRPALALDVLRFEGL